VKFLDYIRVAFRNIGRQKLRSALTIFAVVIGATSVTIMLALATSAKDFFVHQFEATGQLQQVSVSQATDFTYRGDQFNNGGGPGNGNATTPKLTDALIARIKALPHVVNLTGVTQAQGFEALIYHGKELAMGGRASSPPQAYDPNGTIKQQIVAGRDLRESDGVGVIVLSTAYADALGVKQDYGALVGQKVTLRTQYGFSGEGAPVPPAPPTTQGPDQRGPGPGAQPPGFCKGGGGGGPPPSGPGAASCNPSTDLAATIVGVASYGSHQTLVVLPLKWARGLDESRTWVVSMADQDAYDQAQRAFQQARQNCFSPGHPAQCGQQPPPQPHYTLITTNQFDQDGYGEIIVQADSASNAEPLAAAIRTFGVGAASAQAYVNQQEGIFNILALILGGIGAIALVVAAIGVINTMVMAILERTREIGVLRACGATRATIRRLYTFEAAMLGFWGGVFGVLVGFLLTLAANPIINNQLKVNSISSSNIITLPLWLVLAVVAATTLIGTLAGLYPASRAARLNPVEALRYE
jgi:ABC-type antimicrobial peptide transport system permease subunit